VNVQNGKNCPTCNHLNEADAVECARCGASLTGVTTVAAPAVAAIDVLQPLIQPPTLNIGEVMFLVSGKANPITVKVSSDQQAIILGRRMEGENSPHLDLTDLSSTAGSVSRRHAVIRLSGDKPTIEDLGSTNGTWVNENPLVVGQPHPLRTGDLIRLGQQFVFIYFAAGTGGLESIVLTDKREAADRPARLTPAGLTRDIGGYLHALEEIQKLVNAMLGQPAAEVSIQELNVREAPALTRLHIAGGMGAVRLVADRVVPWRKQHMPQLEKLWEAERARSDQVEVLRSEFDLAPLVTQTLQQVAGGLADADHKSYAEKLLPHVRTVALHPFELSANRLRETQP
jgi:pSer/pThr/pTyr-binding forkhead associated (FHA) protein